MSKKNILNNGIPISLSLKPTLEAEGLYAKKDLFMGNQDEIFYSSEWRFAKI
jgi:hypothetical protein